MNRLSTILNRTRKLLYIAFIISLSMIANAQPQIIPDTDPSNRGGTVTITPSRDGEWGRKVSERKDKDGKTLDIITVDSTNDRRRRVRTIIFDKNQDTLLVLYTILDPNMDPTYEEKREYNGKRLTKDETAWYNPEGKKYKWRTLNPNGSYGNYGEPDPHSNWDLHDPVPVRESTETGSICPPRHEIYAGYNYLNLAAGGDERLSVPVGARLTYKYNIGTKLSLDLDVSYNTLSDEEVKEAWLFLLFGPSYKFLTAKNLRVAKNTFEPFVEIKVGAVKHRYKYIDPLFTQSDTHFAAALGGGVNIRICGKVKASINGDYLPIWYKDQMESNFRLGAGVIFELGCRP